MTSPNPTTSAATPLTPTPSVLGRFAWHDLMTPDVDAAKAFYEAVLGWGSEPWAGGAYTMWTRDGVPSGGYMALPAEAGAPPHWLTYIATPDVDATTREVEAAGGRVIHQPEDIPEVGRFAIVQDPQGATFSLFTSNRESPEPTEMAPVGDVSWHELATTDSVAAQSFYERILGWQKASDFDMGPEFGVYRMFSRGTFPLGGIYDKKGPSAQMPTAWCPYFRVADINTTVEKVKANGGQILNGPMEVPGGDLVAQALDAQGALFALHQPKAQ